MSFPKTLSNGKTAPVLATVAIGMVIGCGIYTLRPEIGGFAVTVIASMMAFAIGRALSFHHTPTSVAPAYVRAVKGFHQTAPVGIRKRPTWLRDLADGNFRVEDWQNGEYA
jgi:hypothetical protein